MSDIFPLLEDVLPKGGRIVMLKAYLDLGKKKDATDGIVCVASVVFKPTRYKQFVRPWNRMVRAWGATAFHATDFYNGGGEFKRDTPYRKTMFEKDSQTIPVVIGSKLQDMLLVSFRPDEYTKNAPPGWKEQFGTSIHSIAVQLCLIANGWWRYYKYRNDKFAYFMETGDTDQGEVTKTVERMRADTKTGTGHLIGVASFTPVDKGMARGLEAADFAAWHWNKYYMDKLRFGKKDEPRKDFEALVNSAKPDSVHYIFASGEKLKYFFNLVPPEILEGKNGALETLGISKLRPDDGTFAEDSAQRD